MAATAAFLGLADGAPRPNWGRMVRENSVGVARNAFAMVAPALLLVVAAISVTIAADRLAGTAPLARHGTGLGTTGDVDGARGRQ